MPSTAAEQSSRKLYWHQSGVAEINGMPLHWILNNYFSDCIATYDKPLADVGTSVHAAIERYERNRQQGFPLPDEEGFIASAWYEMTQLIAKWTNVKDRKPDTFYLDKSRAAAKAWYSGIIKSKGISTRELVSNWTLVQAEAYVRASLVPGIAPIAGTLDALYDTHEPQNEYGDTLAIVDWKTAGSFAYWPDADGHRSQAAHYSTLVTLSDKYQVAGLIPVFFAVIRTEAGKRDSFERARFLKATPDLLDVANLRDDVIKAQLIKDTGHFPMDPTYTFCGNMCPCVGGCSQYRVTTEGTTLTLTMRETGEVLATRELVHYVES